MEEIKFIAWDKHAKKIYGPERTESIMSLNGWDQKRFHYLQYIGFQDKNNRDIYEGNIVKYKFYEEKTATIGIIEWSKTLAAFTIDRYLMNSHGLHDIEIIGNIYETKKPEHTLPPSQTQKYE